MSEAVGDAISRRREELGLSLTDLAQMTGLGRATVWRATQGKSLLTAHAQALSEALGWSPDAIHRMEADERMAGGAEEFTTVRDQLDGLESEVTDLIEKMQTLETVVARLAKAIERKAKE